MNIVSSSYFVAITLQHKKVNNMVPSARFLSYQSFINLQEYDHTDSYFLSYSCSLATVNWKSGSP
jgi:hypothetical protein